MKKFLDYFLLVFVALGVFTFTKFLNTFYLFSIIMYGTVITYFTCGLLLSKFYRGKLFFEIFSGVTLVMFVLILITAGPNLLKELLLTCAFATSFLLGYFSSKMKRSYFFLYAIAFLVLSLISVYKIYPRSVVFGMDNKNGEILNGQIGKYLENIHLRDLSNDQYNLPIKNGEVYLIEFYFKACLPCRKKELALKKLEDLHIPNFSIYYVNNGSIDEYDEFKSGLLRTDSNRLYDYQGQLTAKLKLTGFPSELIIDKKGRIRFLSEGYSFDIDNEYINQTKGKINLLVNEK